MQEEQEEIKEIKRTLSDLTAKFEDKFDELSKSVEEQKENVEEKINENTAQEGRTLSDLTAKFEDKFDELSKSVEEQKENAEEKINENTTQEGRIASLESTRAGGHAAAQAGLLLKRMDSLEKHAGATTSPDPRVDALEPQLEGLETRIATLEHKKQSDK